MSLYALRTYSITESKMAKYYKIVGLQETMNNVNRMLQEVQNKTIGGLMKGAEFIRADMDKTPPLIPRKTGELEKSWRAIPFNLDVRKPVVEAGFDKNYALFVHENINPTVKWTKTGSGPKFLELALKRNTEEVIQIVANHVNVDK